MLRKPLVLMAPKGLLRDKRLASPLADFLPGKVLHSHMRAGVGRTNNELLTTYYQVFEPVLGILIVYFYGQVFEPVLGEPV